MSEAHTQLVALGPGPLKMIIIIADLNVSDTTTLETATTSAKDEGTVVVVLNANPSSNVIWSEIASSEEDTFQPDPFSLHNARFIYDRLCPGKQHYNHEPCTEKTCLWGSHPGWIGPDLLRFSYLQMINIAMIKHI